VGVLFNVIIPTLFPCFLLICYHTYASCYIFNVFLILLNYERLNDLLLDRDSFNQLANTCTVVFRLFVHMKSAKCRVHSH